MCDGFYMAWHPHVFVEPIFFAIQNLDGAVHPSSFVFPIQFVIYILTNSDSWGKLCSSHPGPIEVVQSTKYNFLYFLCCLRGRGAQNFGCFHASSEGLRILKWDIGTRNKGIPHLIVGFFVIFSWFKPNRKYQFVTKTFGIPTTLNIRWVNCSSKLVIPFPDVILKPVHETSKCNNCNMKCPGDEWNGKLRLETTINCKNHFDISASFHVLKSPWRNSLSFQTA